ncbi:MAG TPA: PEP/pyruvate-binding domain-containing protein [Rhizomicrobium sp.]|nr:PEP/pyruvate-binding domain-containing protein [Rhizomicrobium sp.]
MNSTEHIGWFADIGLADRASVGGKAGSLGELTRAAIAVPPGFVVRTKAFHHVVEALEREAPVRSLVEALNADDLGGITAVSNTLKMRVQNAPLPRAVEREILGAHGALCGDAPVAVRSSATTEDAEDASFAGLQDTYLWVMGAEAVLHHVRACWASLYSVTSIAYRRKHGLPEDGVAMAVVVQKMVDARTSGVMFTRSPLTGDKSVITVEGAWGLGSSVVGGEVTPDRFVIGKITGDISTRDISDKHIEHRPAKAGGVCELSVDNARRKLPCLSDDELQRLREIGRRIERHYGRPQDIEWAIDQSGAILILQSRPETVWSAKERKPVAKPKDDPLHHVMTIFGGRR